ELGCRLFVCFFFFQAEDGIRYWSVTGVQTCALPICHAHGRWRFVQRLYYQRPWAWRVPRTSLEGRYWPLADIPSCTAHVRFRRESGHCDCAEVAQPEANRIGQRHRQHLGKEWSPKWSPTTHHEARLSALSYPERTMTSFDQSQAPD